MVERGRTTESSARRAYQRLARVDDPAADPTSAYPGEVPTLLRKAAELATDARAVCLLWLRPSRSVRARCADLLGEADQRPVCICVPN